MASRISSINQCIVIHLTSFHVSDDSKDILIFPALVFQKFLEMDLDFGLKLCTGWCPKLQCEDGACREIFMAFLH